MWRVWGGGMWAASGIDSELQQQLASYISLLSLQGRRIEVRACSGTTL
jgi:hypothetical protein